MGRMGFDSEGRLKSVDGASTLDNYSRKSKSKNTNGWKNGGNGNGWKNGNGFEDDEEDDYLDEGLKKSSDLEFLNEEDSNGNGKEREGLEGEGGKVGDVFEKSYWNLSSISESGEKKNLNPLKFSNGKTQEDVVKEIVGHIESGKKIIFLHGTCGTGKSAIALNVARVLGSASVVVPVKALQRQYEKDYMGDKYIMKENGKKLKIAMITGRSNHDSIFFEGKSCADPELPENIKIIEKNYDKLKNYYNDNPLIGNNVDFDVERMGRFSVAPTNPYWSPILPREFEARQLRDAKKVIYNGCDGKEYIFYHRKPGCSYYDQFLAYKKAEVIIFNAAKYNSELSLGRKPETNVEIIDEADDYLDSLFVQEDLNLSRLKGAIKLIFPESRESKDLIDEVIELIGLEEKNKSALGVDENSIYKIGDTRIKEILQKLTKSQELQAEILLDEMNYSNKALDIAKNFAGLMDETYLTYRKDEENLYVKLVSTNLSGKLGDLMSKSKSIVFMSGTLHSKDVLKKVFKMEDFEIVEAETRNLGTIDIVRTGKEFDCKFSNFSSGNKTRGDYLKALNSCLEKAERPVLVHVNAFQDLPRDEEKVEFSLKDTLSVESLKSIQQDDRTGKLIGLFKSGLATELFSTKCSRGVDFPGDTCKSMVFTKYPNPNTQDTFWKVLQKNHPEFFWEFYKDKARREFLQRLYRALRSENDHVFILSPDLRVLNAVQEFQREILIN